MALALYRKYRPRTFAEVIGQEHVTEPLSQALRSGRLNHAYLFSGPRGCGKTTSARILARSLNCEQGPTPDPCGVCGSCKSLMNDGTGSIDVIEIDAASHGGVDDARELREKAFFAPAGSRFKIYIIDEAHMVSSAGFNALLKLVEEPPDYVKFIFATTEPEKVLGTIRSRTHHYPFRLIPPAALRPYLQQLTEAEGVHVEPAVLPLVVRAGGGSARDSLSVLDQLIAGAGPEGVSYTRAVALLGVTDVALLDEMCDALAAGDGAAAYSTIDRVAEAGHDPRRFASDLLERFRDLIVLQQVPDAVTKGLIDGPADQLDAMSAQATRLGPATLSRCADIVHNGLVEMRGTTAPRLLLELITARMLLPGADDTTGALLQRLERMERRLTLTSDPETVRTTTAPDPSSAPPAPGLAETAPGASAAGGGGISAARAAAAAAGRRTAADPGAAVGAGADPGVVAGLGAGADPGVAVRVGDDSGTSPGQPTALAATATVTAGAGVTAGPDAASAGDGTTATDGSESAVDLGSQRARGPGLDGSPAGGREGESTSVGRAAGTGIPASAESGVAEPAHAVPPQVRRPEPTAVLPDAPEELPDDTPAPPGQLTAAAVREVWPEIISDVGRKSKKVAALASGATVRELDGQTVVLTFRFPAHAKMVSDQPQLIVDALYEALGGRWQVRCEVAGEAGGVRADGGAASRGMPAPAQSGSAQGSPAQAGPAQAGQPTGLTATGSPAQGSSGSASLAGSVSPAGSAIPAGPASPAGPAEGRSGGGGPVLGSAGVSGPVATAQASTASGQAGATRQRSAAPPPSETETDGDDWPEPAKPGGVTVVADAPSSGAEAKAGNGSPNAGFRAPPVAEAQPSAAESAPPPGRAANGTPSGRAANGAPSSGLAAARAAAAAGAARLAGAKPAGAKPAGAKPAGAKQAGANPAAPAGGAPVDAWADGSPTEEAPYDPEYDGPPREGKAPASASFEGFDPGDEPLDDVIDEKTARQSSEQQAMQLLQDAFGAEKISES